MQFVHIYSFATLVLGYSYGWTSARYVTLKELALRPSSDPKHHCNARIVYFMFKIYSSYLHARTSIHTMSTRCQFWVWRRANDTSPHLGTVSSVVSDLTTVVFSDQTTMHKIDDNIKYAWVTLKYRPVCGTVNNWWSFVLFNCETT